MPYEHITFAQAKRRLAERLGDTGKVFFTDLELGRYIIEALQWWGLESMYFRETGKVTVFAGETFKSVFDITDSTGSVFLQDLGFSDRSVINDINLALMEPQITNWPGGWVGSEMFTLEDLAASFQEALDETNKLTGYIANVAGSVALAVTDGRTQIPDVNRFIQVLNARILEQGGAGSYPLWPSDQVQLQTTTKSTVIPKPGRPKTYSVSYSPQLTIDLWPPPQTTSTLLLKVVKRDTNATIDPKATETFPFFIPDAAFVLKYRVLADLFSTDGLAKAPDMARYCEARYADGLDTISRYQSLLWAEVGGVRKPLTSLAQLDQLRPTWTHQSGTPKYVAQLNWAVFVVAPAPTTDQVITFEMTRKAPIPILDSDFVRVGRESLGAVLNYAQHIALTKCQGAEFLATVPLYERAKESARDYRNQVASQSYLYRETQLPPIHNRWAQPYRRKGAVEASRQDRQFIEE